MCIRDREVGGPSSCAPSCPPSCPPSAASLWFVGPGGRWPEQLCPQLSSQLSSQRWEPMDRWPRRSVHQPAVLPAVLPARLAYGSPAQEVGTPTSCPPSCPTSAASLWIAGPRGRLCDHSCTPVMSSCLCATTPCHAYCGACCEHSVLYRVL